MLYVVGTPIGNLEDISIRQARTIMSAEYILTEDSRTTGFLIEKISDLFPALKRFPGQKLISYYKEKEFEKLPEILELVSEEKNIVLISESGMPLISDPGFLLVKTLIKKDIPFTVIPGPTAVTTAITCSGFNPNQFMFMGFISKKESEKLQSFNRMNEVSKILKDISFVFYESPNRLPQTLTTLALHYPDCQVVITRELTKKFEEVFRGTPTELLQREYKGEITLTIRF